MAITRDMIQGFIDGHKAAGHKPACLKACTEKYLKAHHSYPSSEDEMRKILEDLGSYRE